MHIVVVHNFYREAGGEDIVVEQEVEALRAGGHTVSTYFLQNSDLDSLRAKIATGMGVIYNRSARRAFTEYLLTRRPDVVHVHNFFPRFSPSIFDACRAAGVPSIMTLHNYRILCPSGLLYHDQRMRERSLTHDAFWTVGRAVYRGSMVATLLLAAMVEFHKRRGIWRNRVDRFIALTEFAKAKFVEGGLPAEKIVVAGHGAPDLGRVRAPSARRHGALFVGRLSPEKGVRELLKAWSAFDYPLTVAGVGPLLEQLKAEAPSGVRFVGRIDRDRLAALMAESAFLVFPSLGYEMFGLVVIEAFSARLPVLISAGAGLAGLVKDGHTGLSFDPHDVESIRAAVRRTLGDPEAMTSMAERARAVYDRDYTSEARYGRLIAIYEDAIASHASATA